MASTTSFELTSPLTRLLPHARRAMEVDDLGAVYAPDLDHPPESAGSSDHAVPVTLTLQSTRDVS